MSKLHYCLNNMFAIAAVVLILISLVVQIAESAPNRPTGDVRGPLGRPIGEDINLWGISGDVNNGVSPSSTKVDPNSGVSDGIVKNKNVASAPKDNTSNAEYIDKQAKKDVQPGGENAGHQDNPSSTNFTCSEVRCAPPPKGYDCKETNQELTPQLASIAINCCAAHACRREDGTVFIHYGFEFEEIPATTNQPPQNYLQQPSVASAGPFSPQPFFPVFPPNQHAPFQGFPSGLSSPGYGVNFGGFRIPFSRPGQYQAWSIPPFGVQQAPASRISPSSLPSSQSQASIQSIYADSGSPFERLSRSAGLVGQSPVGFVNRFDGAGGYNGPLEGWPRVG